MAILDQGRVLRQAETETLRRDVKQIILGRDAYATVRSDFKVLDEREDGDRVAATVEGAERALDVIRREGIEHRIVDLNLDEIFEAYVAGRHQATSATTPRVEMQPLS